MSAREVVHRLAERLRRIEGRGFGPGYFELPSTVRLVVPTFDRPRLDVIAAEALCEWESELHRFRSGTVRVLGLDWPAVEHSAIWHLDPASGRQWPARHYCFDIDFRHQKTLGDIKYVWEINRLQILPQAAAIWRARGDETARDFALDLIESWIETNPPFLGINWASGIELSLRVVNLLAGLSLIGLEHVPSALQQKIARCLNAHLFWLARYPSLYSSANNHRIAELVGIYLIGRFCPDLPNAQALADDAWSELGAEVLRQIHPDGVGAEQSPTYTAFTLELVLTACAFGREAGDEMPPAVSARLACAGNVLRWMMDDAGNVPRIGDDDEGRVLRSGAEETDYVALVLSSLAASLDRPDLAPPTDRAHLRQLWLGRVAAPGTAPKGAAFFDEGGYSILRHRIAGRNSVMVLDHGPLGYLAIAAHGHADALAIWWHLDGQPVLVDAGTYLYHSGGAVRDRYRGTAMHNTLCLGDTDQSKISGAFNWSRKARARRLQMEESNDVLSVEAMHDGYKQEGVEHRRKVALVPDGYLVVDSLLGRPKSLTTPICIRWVLDPHISAQIEGTGVQLRLHGRAFAHVSGEIGPPDAVDLTGQNRLPISGEPITISPAFGVQVETNALVVNLTADAIVNRAVLTRIRVLGHDNDVDQL